jgi:hypothetical protein
MDYVRSLPSCVSGKPAEQTHHIKGYSPITGSGGAIKGDDLFVIPLTREEHHEGDRIGWESWEAKHGSQLEHWAKMIREAHRLGIIRIML